MEKTPSPNEDELHNIPSESYQATIADLNDAEQADAFWQNARDMNDTFVRETIKQANQEELVGKSPKDAFLDGVRWFSHTLEHSRFIQVWEKVAQLSETELDTEDADENHRTHREGDAGSGLLPDY